LVVNSDSVKQLRLVEGISEAIGRVIGVQVTSLRYSSCLRTFSDFGASVRESGRHGLSIKN
jgi:hypothetical protein